MKQKKYFVSKKMQGLCLFILIFGPLTALLDPSFLGIAMFAVGYFCLAYFLTTNLFFGRFTLSEQGITAFVGFKSYFFPWEEIVDVEFFGITSEQVGGKILAQTCFVAFCRKNFPLLSEKPQFYINKHKDAFTFIQYRPRFSAYLREHLRREAREKFIRLEEELRGNMNWLERNYSNR